MIVHNYHKRTSDHWVMMDHTSMLRCCKCWENRSRNERGNTDYKRKSGNIFRAKYKCKTITKAAINISCCFLNLNNMRVAKLSKINNLLTMHNEHHTKSNINDCFFLPNKDVIRLLINVSDKTNAVIVVWKKLVAHRDERI